MADRAAEPLAAIRAALDAGRQVEARALAAAAVAAHPEDPRAWQAHAELERAHGDLVAAHAALLRCLGLDPTRFDAAFLLAVVDDELGESGRARDMLQRLHRARPHDLEVLGELAALHERAGERAAAAALVKDGLALAPRDALLNLVGGRLARLAGELDRAELLLGRAAAGDPHRAALARRELGWLADQRGDAVAASAAFAAANAAERAAWQARHPGPNPWPARLAAMRARQTPAWFAGWTALPPPPPLPFRLAFLVGFPRSGTTLLEQVIGAHPGCRAFEECPASGLALEALAAEPGGYPGALAALGVAARDAIRARYAERMVRAGAAPGTLVLDKFPLRSADLAALHRLFPEARVLLAERDPRDVVLSCWMNGFRLNHEMACFTDLAETVAVHDAVLALCHDAEQALRPPLHRVRYERVVDDLEGEARAALGFLGLAWDPQVLDWAERARGRAIRTPSYAAVRGAIHDRARGRWRRYQALLAPQQAALARWVERLGYAEAGDGR